MERLEGKLRDLDRMVQEVKWLRSTEIDVEKWDQCVRSDSSKIPYVLHWYLDLVAPTWDALVLNDYEVVMPLPYSVKMGIHYLYRPIGSQQLGLFGRGDLQSLLPEFIHAIPKKFWLVDYYLNEQTQAIGNNSFKWEKQINQCLSLKPSYERLYAAYNAQTRRNVQKSKKHKLRLFEYDGPDVLLTLFKANKGANLQLSEKYYTQMRRIFFSLMHKKRGFVWTVHDEHNSACAGVFLFQNRDRLILLFTATDATARENAALSFLLDELIIRYSGGNYLLDFEGSNIPGLARFNAGFGAEERPYYRIRKAGFPLNLHPKYR